MEEVKVFKNIRGKVLSLPVTINQLNLIKNHFREEIDSPRRFDRIINLNGLIRILEKRDVLSEEDISPLKYIASVLKRNDLLQIMNTDCHLQEQPEQPTFVEPEVPIRGRVLPKISQDPIKRVDDIICTEIGQKWNELARKLNVPEGFIDELEHRYRRISDMVREILVYHRENNDERYWKVNLCKALEEARRRDLCFKVQEVFAMYKLM